MEGFSERDINMRHRRSQVFERKLLCFQNVDTTKVKKIVQRMKFTYCKNNPFPISEVMENENDDILHMFLQIINLF